MWSCAGALNFQHSTAQHCIVYDMDFHIGYLVPNLLVNTVFIYTVFQDLFCNNLLFF